MASASSPPLAGTRQRGSGTSPPESRTAAEIDQVIRCRLPVRFASTKKMTSSSPLLTRPCLPPSQPLPAAETGSRPLAGNTAQCGRRADEAPGSSWGTDSPERSCWGHGAGRGTARQRALSNVSTGRKKKPTSRRDRWFAMHDASSCAALTSAASLMMRTFFVQRELGFGLLQRRAIDVLHGDVELCLRHHRLLDLADAGVIDARLRARFLHEAYVRRSSPPRMNFSATMRRRRRSRALYTAPMPPLAKQAQKLVAIPVADRGFADGVGLFCLRRPDCPRGHAATRFWPPGAGAGLPGCRRGRQGRHKMPSTDCRAGTGTSIVPSESSSSSSSSSLGPPAAGGAGERPGLPGRSTSIAARLSPRSSAERSLLAADGSSELAHGTII